MRLRQEVLEFQTSMSYTLRPSQSSLKTPGTKGEKDHLKAKKRTHTLHVKLALTLPRVSTGNLELSNTGFTLSPDRNPSTGLKLSKMASYLALSSDCNTKRKMAS